VNIMANPKPFSSGTEGALRASDAFERALLDSARSDEVPEGARGRVALALGIGVPVAELDSADLGPANHGPANHGPANHDSASLASLGRATKADAVAAGSGPLALAGKVALVSLAGGLVALLLLARSSDPGATTAGMAPAVRTPAALSLPAPFPGHERSNESLVPASPALAAGPVAPADTAKPATPLDVPQASPPRAASRPRSRAARPAAPPAVHPPATNGESRLLAEVARLDQARAALASSDPPRALEHVERYRAEFPNGALAREAARIEARARAQASGSIGKARDIGEAR
jgi:hypothetical protein